jgi:hypothetical protein
VSVTFYVVRHGIGFVDGVHLPAKCKQNIPERYDARRTGTVCQDWIPEIRDHDKNGQKLDNVPFKPKTTVVKSRKPGASQMPI